jgi:hypothetical protein
MEPWQLITGISVLLGIGGTATGLWATIRTQRRADKTETRNETANFTVITVKLDQINTSMAELKAEVKAELRINRDESRELRDRMAMVEATVKQVHDRLDEHIKDAS